ncbi:hypothetical protein Ddc_09488 [Ditylenchus destructor]|nr:hypothetical protein Ddc_09488 [Ditylenchus destructor]
MTQTEEEHTWIEKLSLPDAKKYLKHSLKREADLKERNAELSQSLLSATAAIENTTKAIPNLVATNDRLTQNIIVLQDELKLLREQLNNQSKPETTQYGQPPLFQEQFMQMVTEIEQRKSKSLRAVIEKAEEKETEEETKEADEKLIETIISINPSANLPKPTSVYRHGHKKPERNRIMKLQFTSENERNNFIRNFRTASMNNDRVPNKIRCRRDMTQSELTKLYTLRKQCYESNKDAGKVEFQLNEFDLKMVKLSKPRAFRNGTA